MPAPRLGLLPFAPFGPGRPAGVWRSGDHPRSNACPFDKDPAFRPTLSHLSQTPSASALLSLDRNEGTSSDDFPNADSGPSSPQWTRALNESRIMPVLLSMTPFHQYVTPFHARGHGKPSQARRCPAGILFLCLLLGIVGTLFYRLASPDIHDVFHSLRILASPGPSTRPEETILRLAIGNAIENTQGALPCHHFRTTGCSLECPHEGFPPGRAPGVVPDLSLPRPLTLRLPLHPLHGVFRTPPTRPSHDGILPDPPPRGPSIQPLTRIPQSIIQS